MRMTGPTQPGIHVGACSRSSVPLPRGCRSFGGSGGRTRLSLNCSRRAAPRPSLTPEPAISPSTLLATLRRVVACLMGAHGAYRAADPDRIRGFGGWLTSLQLPAGDLLAAGITGAELVGALALYFGWRRRLVASLFAAELLVGIGLIHASEGWFVVGGGRNGMEYSVLLIAVLLAVAAESPPQHDRG